MKQRILAFAAALAVVFAAAAALWSPEKTAQESADAGADEWVGYFLAPFQDGNGGEYHHYEGKYWASRSADGDYDFGIPGSACFVMVTEITPDDPAYEPNSHFNFSIDSAQGDGITSGGMHVSLDDEGARYEIEGTFSFSEAQSAPLYTALDVYRTSGGEYYAEEGASGRAFSDSSAGITAERSVSIGGETRTISVSLSFESRPALVRAAFTWLDAEKGVLLREEYEADALPSELTPPECAALLLVTQTQQTRDGACTARALLSPEEEILSLYPAAEQEGLLRAAFLPIRWEN